MSSYDVHIGKLISGKRKLEGEGSYLLCTPDKQIIEVLPPLPQEAIVIRAQDMENALYQYCLSALEHYIAEGHNRDVYTFSIYTDTYHGSYVIYINNMECLKQSVEQYFAYYAKKYEEGGGEHYNKTREQHEYDLKYAEGDYAFMYEHMPAQLEHWLGIFHNVSTEYPEYLEIEQSYLFEKQLFDSQLFLIAINVIERLRPQFEQLNKTADFIAYVSAADGVGGDFLKLSQLIRKNVTQQQLYLARSDVQEMDEQFRQIVEQVSKKSLSEQIEHWVAAIDGGEFGEHSVYSYCKTDYEAYEQLLKLGKSVIEPLQTLLERRPLKQETKYVLEMVLQDIQP